MESSARKRLSALAVGVGVLVASIGSAKADIVETQIFGTFGAWTAYRDRYDDDNSWVCATQTDVLDRRSGQRGYLSVFSTYLAFSRDPDLIGGEEVFFDTGDVAFQFYLDRELRTAFSQDADDFLALYALARASRIVSVVVRDRSGTIAFDFPAGGFRQAYEIMGQACDFDTGLVLDTPQ